MKERIFDQIHVVSKEKPVTLSSGEYIISNLSTNINAEIVGGKNSTIYFKLLPLSRIQIEDLNGFRIFNESNDGYIHVHVISLSEIRDFNGDIS